MSTIFHEPRQVQWHLASAHGTIATVIRATAKAAAPGAVTTTPVITTTMATTTKTALNQ